MWGEGGGGKVCSRVANRPAVLPDQIILVFQKLPMSGKLT